MRRSWPSNLRYRKMMGKAGEKILKALTQLYSHYLLIKIVS